MFVLAFWESAFVHCCSALGSLSCHQEATKQKIRQGGRVSKCVIVAQKVTRAQIRTAQGEEELLEPPDDVVEVDRVVGMRPRVIQEVQIPAPDLQAIDRTSQCDSSSGLGNNPSNSSPGNRLQITTTIFP